MKGKWRASFVGRHRHHKEKSTALMHDKSLADELFLSDPFRVWLSKRGDLAFSTFLNPPFSLARVGQNLNLKPSHFSRQIERNKSRGDIAFLSSSSHALSEYLFLNRIIFLYRILHYNSTVVYVDMNSRSSPKSQERGEESKKV
jgi:hypothetical protein